MFAGRRLLQHSLILLSLIIHIDLLPFSVCLCSAQEQSAAATTTALSPLMAHLQRIREQEEKAKQEMEEKVEQRKGGFDDDGRDEVIPTVLENGEVMPDDSTTPNAATTTEEAIASIELMHPMAELPLVPADDDASTTTTTTSMTEVESSDEAKQSGAADTPVATTTTAELGDDGNGSTVKRGATTEAEEEANEEGVDTNVVENDDGETATTASTTTTGNPDDATFESSDAAAAAVDDDDNVVEEGEGMVVDDTKTTTAEMTAADNDATATMEAEGQGKSTRAAEPAEEQLPDPEHVADPSLEPVHKQRPDYRPLITTGQPELPPTTTTETATAGEPAEQEAQASSTVVNMGDEGEEEEEAPTTTTTMAPTTEQTEAEAAEEQAETKEAEAATAQAEAEQKEQEAEAAQTNAAEAAEQAEEAQTRAEGAEAEAAQTEAEAKEAKEQQAEAQEEQAEIANSAQEAGEQVAEAIEGNANVDEEQEAKQAEAEQEEQKEEKEEEKEEEEEQKNPMQTLTDALESGKLLVQNITLVLPGDTPSLQAFIGALLGADASKHLLLSPPVMEEKQTPSPLPPPSLPMAPSLSLPQRWPMPMPAPIPISSAAVPAPFPAAGRTNGYAAPAPQAAFQQQQQQQQQSFLVDVEQLHSWLKSGANNVKLVDASYEPEAMNQPPDHIRFYTDYYGRWNKLMREKKNRQYERSHIAQAIPFNMNIATYPSWNERQALYPPERFEEYVQRLGIDRGDRLVIYARGPLGGMLHAARVWFLFRVYGHENVSVLNGGFDAWRRAELPATDALFESGLGNWKATFRPELVVTFEELSNRNSDGHCLLSRIYWYNFLDARPRNEFFGITTAAGAQQVSRLTGAKSFPADELIQMDGLMVPPMEIMRRLQLIGYSRQFQTIMMGNNADEASLALLAMAQVQDTTARLYNGGMEEIRRRAPHLVAAAAKPVTQWWRRK